MLAAFSATLGVIAALFVGFLVFRFWRVAVALLGFALIVIGGVVGWIYYEDARTKRIYDEKVAAEQRMSRAVDMRQCESLPKPTEVEMCELIIAGNDRLDEEARQRAAAEVAKQPARQ
jgi:hypothetical protein